MASAISPPRTASATACGSMACCASCLAMARRRMLKVTGKPIWWARGLGASVVELPVHGAARRRRRHAAAWRPSRTDHSPFRYRAVAAGGRMAPSTSSNSSPRAGGIADDRRDDERCPLAGAGACVGRESVPSAASGRTARSCDHRTVDGSAAPSAAGDRHLVGRIEPRELARQHCQLVLPEVLAIQAAGQRVGLE